MGKAKKIKLSIPKPCSENWDKMTPGEKGRHCSLCNKVITDFSTFTDKELLAYFTKAKGEICGRVGNSQLDRLLITNDPSNTPIYRRLLFGAALTAGLANTAHSQNTGQPNKAYPHPVGHIAASYTTAKTTKPIAADTSTVIKGSAIEIEKKKPITYAVLSFQFDSTYSTEVYTDSIGKFSISVPNKYLNKESNVTLSSDGYMERHLTFHFAKSNKEIIIKLRKRKDDGYKMGKMAM